MIKTTDPLVQIISEKRLRKKMAVKTKKNCTSFKPNLIKSKIDRNKKV